VVGAYSPRDYAAQRKSDVFSLRRKPADSAGQCSPAILCALRAHGPGSPAELAAVRGCRESTIRQQAAKFADHLDITKELVVGANPRRPQWAITRISLKQPNGASA
jgi:hypothetical protein